MLIYLTEENASNIDLELQFPIKTVEFLDS